MKKQNEKKPRIVVGMSGGVDSSAALVLLKKQGWQPVGVSLKYAVWQDKKNLLKENVCCSAESFKIAKRVCQKMNTPHYVFDVSREFKKEVIDYFIKELKRNRTPNPCVICNRRLKFKKLFEWAHKHNIQYVATGHYAQIKKESKGKYSLLKARDEKKDQTYSLAFLQKEWLKNIVFPLGDYTKNQVFKIAKNQGFGFYLKRKQSQDFCFVSGKCLKCFLEKEIGSRQGIIKNKEGKVLGVHQGLHFYTIGQRKGIELAGGPYFVISKDFKTNTLFVSKNKKDLLAKEAVLFPFNFISEPKRKARVLVKIRSQHDPVKARLNLISPRKLKIVFDNPQKAVTPGQFAVFYQGNNCLGGGRILS